jgi:hypothetical protein
LRFPYQSSVRLPGSPSSAKLIPESIPFIKGTAMSETRPHLVVGTPCYGGQVFSNFANSLLKLQAACAKRGLDLSINMMWGDALITRARQNIVTQFLDQPTATHLLFIDADIEFEPEQVFRLLDFDVDMVSAAYPTKKVDWDKARVMAQAGVKDLKSVSLSYVVDFTDPKKIEVRNGFAKIRYAGTGFLLIRRQVLLKMMEHYPDLKYSGQHLAQDPFKDSPYRYALFNCFIEPETGIYLSEDYSFCRRWTDMGGEIWVDLDSRLNHVGPMIFNGNLRTQFPTL